MPAIFPVYPAIKTCALLAILNLRLNDAWIESRETYWIDTFNSVVEWEIMDREYSISLTLFSVRRAMRNAALLTNLESNPECPMKCK